MGEQLLVIRGPDFGQAFQVPKKGTLLIGRRTSADISLNDRCISRAHCKIHVKDGVVFISDTSSRTGTFVNSLRVVFQRLLPGDIIRIGASQIQYGGDRRTLPAEPPVDAVDVSAPVLDSLDKDPETLKDETVSGSLAQTLPDLVDPTDLADQPGGEPDDQDLMKLLGQRLGGFEVGAPIARGRTGFVFLGRSRSGRNVALKVLWPAYSEDLEKRRRFIRAMKTGHSLRHAN